MERERGGGGIVGRQFLVSTCRLKQGEWEVFGEQNNEGKRKTAGWRSMIKERYAYPRIEKNSEIK